MLTISTPKISFETIFISQRKKKTKTKKHHLFQPVLVKNLPCITNMSKYVHSELDISSMQAGLEKESNTRGKPTLKGVAQSTA